MKKNVYYKNGIENITLKEWGIFTSLSGKELYFQSQGGK